MEDALHRVSTEEAESNATVSTPRCVSTQLPASTSSAATCLASLPDALLAAIAAGLHPRSLAALCATSPAFRHLVKSNDTIWRAQCQQLLGNAAGATPAAWGAVSWRHLYLSLLQSHGWMLGLWAAQGKPHGGLVLVRAEAPCIAAYSVIATRLNGPVWLRRMFEVRLRTGDKRGTECQCTYHSGAKAGFMPHAASVQCSSGNGFEFSCSRGCQHALLDLTLRRTAGHMPRDALVPLTPHGCAGDAADALEVHPGYHHVQFMHFMAEQSQALLDGSMADVARRAGTMLYARLPCSPPNISSLMAGAAEVAFATPALSGTLSSSSRSSDGSSVSCSQSGSRTASAGYSSSSSSRVVQYRHKGARPLPGLWRGTYGPHGIELLQLEDHGDCIVATKVTGDSNVPAGQVSFVIFTGTPLTMLPGCGLPYTPPASYTSAVDFSATSDSSRPAFVARAHYPASGHAAGRGFSESAWVSNEVLVANERCFGMLWHILHSFALFTRIDDILS